MSALLNFSVFTLLFFKGIVILFTEQHFNLLFDNDFLMQNISGLLLILTSFIALLPEKLMIHFKLHYAFIFSFLTLSLHSISTFVEADYVPEQLIEHALQLFLPLIALCYRSFHTFFNNWSNLILKILVALTFTGHGIYAIGLHFIPGSFIQMSCSILSLNPSGAHTFLYVIGLLDLLFSVTLFFKMTEKLSLYYMALWGLTTSIARLWHGLVIGASFDEILLNHLPNALYRLPHGIIPILLLTSKKALQLSLNVYKPLK